MSMADAAKSSAVYYAAEHRLVIEVIFSPQEAALFGLLVRNQGRIVPKDIQIGELWPIHADEPQNPDNTTSVHLHNIRAKLAPISIEVAKGTGLRLLGKMEIDWSVPDL